MSEQLVLLVEDNQGDVRLIEEAFENRSLPGTLRVVGTGREALDWIFNGEEDTATRTPDVVLLDLNLPGVDGHEVLDEIKSDPDTRHIPVVVLTSSQSEMDILQAWSNYANACITKPVDPEVFGDRIETFAEFWLDIAILPSQDEDEQPDKSEEQ